MSSDTLSVALFIITFQKCESLSIFPPKDSNADARSTDFVRVHIFQVSPSLFVVDSYFYKVLITSCLNVFLAPTPFLSCIFTIQTVGYGFLDFME